ncbi:MAG: hypothetical protein RQ753_07490, partial [Desulfurivibrionaceae bacterium]|nr:hypothetical protein [Desulfurivibrionaceae bacterium]
MRGEDGKDRKIMLLIYPPLAKACEPPAGLAMLAGALRGHGHPCTMLDANLEGQLHLLRNNPPGRDTWSRRAHRHRAANLAALRDPGLYAEPARYHRAVSDLSRTLGGIGRDDLTINLANYQDHNLSPLRSADLLRAADHPAGNLFYDYFAPRLDELLQQSPPHLIGFSINYLSQALTAFAMIGYLKRKHPGLPIAAGGGLITSWLSTPAVTDHGIRHPGLANLPAGKRLQGGGDARHRLAMCSAVHEQADNTADSVSCDRLPPPRRDPFNGLIDHLVAGPGEGTLLNILAGQATAEENDNICPDFKGLPLADYLAPGPILPYAASSGCYWRQCSFCPEK